MANTLVLGGSWVVISRVISRVSILITHIRGLLTPLITTHEPPSRALNYTFEACSFQSGISDAITPRTSKPEVAAVLSRCPFSGS